MTTDTGTWSGQVLAGRYQVTAKLGEGGMGFVYRAHDRNLDSDVVIKVPRPIMLKDPKFASRFSQEIRSLVKLAHPHIVKITDVGEHDGLPFAVMQYLSGGSLKERQRVASDGTLVPMRLEEIADWLGEVAEALDFIHKQKYIHRDVKPANILFDAHGNVYLSDFGVAKALAQNTALEAQTVLTGDGMALGTPHYMAPELVMAKNYDGRVDQYALAVTVYELLGSRHPFEGPTPAVIMAQQMAYQPPPLHTVVPAVPRTVSDAVQKAIAKKPEQRYPDCSSFARAVLEAINASAPTQAASPVADRAATATLAAESVSCPNCKRGVRLHASAFGRRVRCPTCQAVFQAPPPRPTPQAQPAVSDTGPSLQAQAETPSGGVNKPAPGPATAGVYRPVAAPPPKGPARPRSAFRKKQQNRPWVLAGVGLGGVLAAGIIVWIIVQAVFSGGDADAAPVRLEPISDVTLTAGKSRNLDIKVERKGYDGPIGIQLEGLPPKVAANPVTIPADRKEAGLVLITLPDATEASREVRLIASFGEQHVETRFRITVKQAAAFQFEPIAAVTLAPGQTTFVDIKLDRRGVEGTIDLKVEGLPAKVTAGSSTIAADQSSGKLQLTAAADAGDVEATAQVAASIGGRRSDEPLRISVKKPALASVPLGLIRSFPGHSFVVNSVAFSPDSSRAVSGSFDGSVRLWDVETGKEIRQFEGHSKPVECVAYSPDGRHVLSGSQDSLMILWNVDTGREVRRFEGHTRLVTSLAFSRDGNRIISGSFDETVRVWDVQNGRELSRMRGHTDFVRCVAFSFDGRQAISGSDDGTIRLWDVQREMELRSFPGHKGWVTSVALSRDGRYALSSSYDNTVRLWDVNDSTQERRRLDGHTDRVWSVAFSPDGRRALSGSTDGTVRLWDVESGKELQRFEGHKGEVRSVVFSSDGRYALSGGTDGVMRLWGLP